MTADSRTDPRLDAWLDQMPVEAPDRVIDAILLAVEGTPQVRPPLVRAPWRDHPMHRFTLIAATAAVAVAAIGGALIMTGGRDDQPLPSTSAQPSEVAATPTATPSPAPQTPTAVPAVPGADLPDELVGVWFGSHREVPGIDAAIGTALAVGPTQIAFAMPNAQARLLATTPFTLDEEGRLQADGGFSGRCDGVVGRYGWTLSDSGHVLTITPDQDDCAVRAAALQGEWWRAACRSGPTCLGDLDAGTYGSQYFNARDVGAGTWVPVDGAIRYTVPAGWANSDDWPSRFVLMPPAEPSRS